MLFRCFTYRRNTNRQRAYNAAWDDQLISTVYNTGRKRKWIPTAWNAARDHEQWRNTARNARFQGRAYNAAWNHKLTQIASNTAWHHQSIPTAHNARRNQILSTKVYNTSRDQKLIQTADSAATDQPTANSAAEDQPIARNNA